MEILEMQQGFFNHLKNTLPPHLSIVDELCDLLDLSADSVYRRLRGEKPITLTELKLICEKYHVSLDNVLQLQNNTVVFHSSEGDGEIKDLKTYLEGLLSQFSNINTFTKKEMCLLAKDLPVTQFFMLPEMAAFKCYFWMRHILGDERLTSLKFSIKNFPFPEILDLGKKIAQTYCRMESIEVWNEETIRSTLRQIRYYQEAGLFDTAEDAEIIYNSFDRYLAHVESMAERGYKFMPGESEWVKNGSYQLFVNELILGNNTYIFNLDGKLITFLNYAVLKYISTRDIHFCDNINKAFQNLVNRSTLISKVGEKERSRFFNNLREEIKILKSKL